MALQIKKRAVSGRSAVFLQFISETERISASDLKLKQITDIFVALTDKWVYFAALILKTLKSTERLKESSILNDLT